MNSATGATAPPATLEASRSNEAASGLSRFTWDEFCDGYVGLAKPLLAGGDEATAHANARESPFEAEGSQSWITTPSGDGPTPT